ncbi:MAG: hypothetical protein EXR72_10150 [Myxococcales bacterium]|nr:hypothetical protein [Myxococcales bacterium]
MPEPPLPSRRAPPPPPVTDGRPPPKGAIDQLIDLGRDEVGAGSERKRGDDLRVRLALLSWDGRGDPLTAAAWLEGVDHPAAHALRLQLALLSPDRADLSRLSEEALRRGQPLELAELGELCLWRSDDPGRAAQLLAAGGATSGSDVREGLAIALDLAGRHAELCTLLERDGDREDLIAAAQTAQDRLDQRDAARALLRRASLRSGPPDPYLIERLLELPPDDRAALLRARLELLATDPATAGERAATQFELAAAIEESAPAEADGLLAALEGSSDFGRHLALRARARVAAARGDHRATAAAWASLGRLGGNSPWSRACARRAAELSETRAGDPAAAEAIYSRLHAADPGHKVITRALVRLLLARQAPGEAAPVLEAFARARGEEGRSALLRAARAAEAAEARPQWAPIAGAPTAPTAVDRWRAAAGPLGHREALEALARAHRRAGERLPLAQVYRRLAAHLDPRAAAAYLTVAGTLALEAGDLRDADDLLREATTRDPSDLLAHAARALCARAAGPSRVAEFAAALAAELELVENPATRADLLRQRARLASQLADLPTAEEAYGRALAIEPDDPTTLHELSRISFDLGRFPRAVELRERAAALQGGTLGAGWLCEVGAIHERHQGDDERARSAYQRARELDERSRPALHALAALHRKHKRLPELLDVLRCEIRIAPDRETRLAVQLEIGRSAEAAGSAAGSDAQAALDAWRDALRIDAINAEALAGVERLCRAGGLWADLAEVLARVPRVGSSHTLHVLGEAFEHLGQWQKLAEVREQEVILPEVAADRPRLAALARSLAELHEEKLDDLDAAARAWHRVDEAVGDLDAVRALQRIYAARGRFADLAASIERELTYIQPRAGGTLLDPERALDLWLRLGDVRRLSLNRPGPAAEAYERALESAPAHPAALASLAELYAKLERPRDLERVIDLRAAATVDPHERAALLIQKGELLERTGKSGDLDEALSAFAGAFAIDPGSRSAFTALERLCYRRERWREAMELYDRAIQLVETQKSRSYRLADLYARRGQVQLQHLGEPAEAAVSYLRVLELDPDGDVAQTALERIFSQQSDFAALIGAYERRAELLRDDGKRTEVLRRAARVASAKLRDPKRAALLYERLHATDPTDAEALDALERHFETGREWDKLIDILRTRLSLTAGGDDAIKLHLRIATLCEEGKHDAELAIEAYRKILEVAPSHRAALDALARLYEGTEKWPELVDVTRRQIRVVTDRAQKALMYFKCGSVMESKFNKDDDAIRYYDAAIRTSPSCLPAVHGLRDLYLRREDWPQVVKSLELEAKLWTEEKERAGVLAHIGTIYGDKLRDVDRAVWYFEAALGVDAGCLAANRSLFEVFFARGDYARALPVGQLLTQKVMREGDPEERSEFYRKRAIVARETGDLAAAAESLVVGLEIRPDHVAALDLLVDLASADLAAASQDGRGLCYDFATTFRELEKLYRKRDSGHLLARVLCGLGALQEREYEIDKAEQLYREALALAPDDYAVVDAGAWLDVRLRRFDDAIAAIDTFLAASAKPPVKDPPGRARARLRLAEIHSDCALDPRRAADALRALLVEQPTHRDAHYRLAQELYLLGSFGEAQKVCERLIQVAAAPGATSPPDDLARYYDYLGRIAEAMGDPNGAARSYRRAVELDPAYAPPALALIRRAAAAGDDSQVALLEGEAISAATERGQGALRPLQRGLARFHVGQGDLAGAVDLYRQILSSPTPGADNPDDRVALATLYARDPQTRQLAREELYVVLSRDLRHAPAYRLLMQIYARAGHSERAARVGSILQLLGYAGPDEEVTAWQGRIRRGSLGEAQRRALLLPPLVIGAYTEALQAVREPLEAAYPPPNLGELTAVSDPAFRVCVVDVQRLLGVEAEVLLGRHVPGGAMSFESPRRAVVLDASLAARPDRERRFLLGRALEPLRGGYAMPLRLRPTQRAELGHLLDQLLRPPADREPQVRELVDQLPKKSVRAVEKLAGLSTGGTITAWYAAVEESCDRAGLLACDDLAASVAMLARLSGEELALASDGSVTLGQVAGDAALVRFFLSDAYHELRATLGDPSQSS